MLTNTRTALVTGASRGIGLACAQLLAKSDYRLILVARSQDKLTEAASELRADGVEVFTAALDLASYESITQVLPQVLKEAGNVDVLVNNAGLTRDGLSMRMKREDWDSVLQTNLSGTFYVTQLAMPAMMKQRWGRIINIASVVGRMGNPGQANYVASKAGMIGLTKTLAQELGARNITVNAIAPGFIETEMTSGLSTELKEKMIERTPLRRMGTAVEIAHAVRFLASEEAGFITGQVLDVNGGIYM